MPFNVTVQPAGRSFSVERDESILGAAIRQGIGLPYGCRDGACGSCKSRLVSGRVIHGAHQAKALGDDEEAAGWTLTCKATPQCDVVIESRMFDAAGEFAPRKMPARVSRIERPAADVAILHLQLPANDPLRYRAGQYVEFILRDGARRSYSMANAPRGADGLPAIELHIRHLPGGKFSDHVFGAMKEKEILRLEGPFGSFFLREDSDAPIILLAAGTGLAPIKAIVEQLERSGSRRRTELYWGCRTRADLYLHDWALQAARRLPALRYVPVLSDAAGAPDWDGRRGLVHEALMHDHPALAGWQVYACGAPAMVDAARRDLVQRCGLAVEDFFADAFTSELDKLPAP